MLQVQGSLRIHTFSSAAVVHAVESSDEDTNPPHFSAVPRNGKKASREEIRKKVKRLVSSLRQKHHISKAANNEAIDGRGGGGQSDVETFVSAKSSELCSFRTDDGSEPPSFRLSPPPIFPAGCVEGQHPASPVKIIKKLPFGYVIGRRLDAPAAAVPSTKISLSFKNLMPRLVDLQLKSRSKMIRKKVVRALKERFRGGGGRQGRDEHAGEDKESINDGDGDDDEDVFWRKDVRGLRCRRVQDSDLPY